MQLSGLSGFDAFGRTGGSMDLLAPMRRGWTGLMGCLPSWLRRAFGAEIIRLIVDASSPQWRTAFQLPGIPVKTLDNQDPAIQPDLRELLDQAKRLRAGVVLLIPKEEVLVRRVNFPTPTPERLKKTINHEFLGYELDRLTPFPAQDIYHEFRILPTASQSHVEVELAAVRKTIVDKSLSELQKAGGLANVVSWHGAWYEANLLPVKQRGRPKNTGRVWRWLLGFLIIALAAAAIISPLIQKRAIVIDLTAKVDKARAEAAKVGDLRVKIEQEQKSANVVVEQKIAAGYTISLLARLTELVPDNAWLNLLNYANGQVDISGEARQATALIELLAKNPAFQNSNFRSPVTGIRASGNERFNIQFNYMGREGG